MNRKLILAVALASAFAVPMSAAYAEGDEDKKPEQSQLTVAEGDEDKKPESSQLIAEGDEDKKPESSQLTA
jgi:Ni/Co efflux regulator RcnB